VSYYRVAPLFLIRAAGVPFDWLDRLSTSETAKIARRLLDSRSDLSAARAAAERLVGTRESGLSADVSRAYRATLRTGELPNIAGGVVAEEISKFVDRAAAVRDLDAQLQQTLERELETARAELYAASREVLPPYLVFGAGDFQHRVAELSDGGSVANGELPPRNARTRERERHLLLYLQRVCAKNDTFSEFGPSAWGTVEQGGGDAVLISPQPGIAERIAFLERWTAHAIAAALNNDPEARAELAPRLNPNGRIEGDEFVLSDTGERMLLTPEARAIVAQCDGRRAAHSLGSMNLLEQLAEQRVLVWQAEVPGLEPNAAQVLLSQIDGWRDSPARSHWQERTRLLASLPEQFSRAVEVSARTELMDNAHTILDGLGATQTARRSLYSAANPIAEECFRRTDFRVSDAMTDELTRDIEPWLDLWRDTYAFVASRVAEGLRGLLEAAPVENGAIALPAFLQHCAANKLPLTGHGIVALAHMAFQEVKGAFRKSIAAREDAAEWQLTADDCSFVRRTFDYPKFDEYTYPSADLQISAASVEAVNRGEYQWVVSELHPPVAMLHHALFWSCPDHAALSRELSNTTFGRPAVHYGFFAADFTAHTVVRQMDALPDSMTFVAPQPAHSAWRALPPSEVEVHVDESSGDVCMRRRGSHEHLGSFARAWIIPLGFHPFFFGRPPHMPRLRCGKAVVQRRSWTVVLEELKPGNYTGISRDLVLAIEQLRAEKGWPRHVYTRPTEQALRRSGAEGRDKDTKPIFIDLESYPSLEIFHRWLAKAGELEVTEMLPDPDHLLWQEPDGRRTFEMRTLIVPRS
jgi:hypothetical protein